MYPSRTLRYNSGIKCYIYKRKQAMVLLHLKSASLISLGQLFDDESKVLLEKRQLFCYKTQSIGSQRQHEPTRRI